ncbi:MAG: Ig domain-containing protein, partial [Clostridia bacterium]|nr:Ig domain-containing protein [Clostridia bacterium]
MFKGKKWWIGLCALLMTCGFAACSSSSDSSSSSIDEASSSTSSESSSQAPVPSLTLSAETLTMDLFDSVTLSATMENLSGDAIWTTSAPTIVTVDNGKLFALDMGTANVTVTVGDYSAICAVTVVRGETNPEFDALGDTLSLVKNSTFPLNCAMSVNGEEFDLAECTFETTGNV